jgi:hypothetical protein
MTTSTELFGDAHVRRYIETDGEEGFYWRHGTKILVLFTKGAKVRPGAGKRADLRARRR